MIYSVEYDMLLKGDYIQNIYIYSAVKIHISIIDQLCEFMEIIQPLDDAGLYLSHG